MQVDNKAMDDLARLASGAVSVAAGVRTEVEAQLRQVVERWLDRLDVVPREEFDAVKAMAAAARAENEDLAARLTAIETAMAARSSSPAKARTESAKPRAKSAKPRTESAKVRTESAKVRAESAKVRTKSVKVRAKTAKS